MKKITKEEAKGISEKYDVFVRTDGTMTITPGGVPVPIPEDWIENLEPEWIEC